LLPFCDLKKSEQCTENTGFPGRFLKATFVPRATESLMPWRLPAARFRDAGGAMIRLDPTALRQMATQDRNRQRRQFAVAAMALRLVICLQLYGVNL